MERPKSQIALPVSVVIPTMNRPQSLEKTISSLLSHPYIPNEIILVDQSTDLLLRKKNEEIGSLKVTDLKIRYFYLEIPSSTKARNIGTSYVTNDILVYADDDIEVEPDTIGNIYEIMQQGEVALLAGIDKNSKASTRGASWLGYLFGTKSYAKRNIGHITNSVLGRYPDRIEGQVLTEWAMGYFFIVRKSLVAKWQIAWDEKLTSYAYAEDLDFSCRYCRHAAAEGFKCVLDTRIQVYHMYTREYRVPSKKSSFMYIINRKYLGYKLGFGFRSSLMQLFANFSLLLRRLVAKQRPQDIISAQFRAWRYGKQLKKGEINATFYE